MFFHLFKYQLKQIFGEKHGVFWLMVYPLLMAVLFYVSFANLTDGKFKDISAAVVMTTSNDQFLGDIKSSGLFDITETDKNTALQMLKDGKISVICEVNNKIQLTVGSNGIDESIAKVFADTYQQTVSTVTNIASSNPDILKDKSFIKQISTQQSFTKEKDINNNNDQRVVMYYALIAMSCILSGTISIDIMEKIQANLSAKGARVSVAPTHKLKAFCANISAAILQQCFYNFLLVMFIWKVLGVGFGNYIGYVLMVAFIGSITGLMIGSSVSALIKKSANFKTGVYVGITIFGCFLSGMMSSEIRYLVQKKLPWLAEINPINHISDALYSLYYYGVCARYFKDLILLSLFAVAGCIITYLALKRQKYESVATE